MKQQFKQLLTKLLLLALVVTTVGALVPSTQVYAAKGKVTSVAVKNVEYNTITIKKGKTF